MISSAYKDFLAASFRIASPLLVKLFNDYEEYYKTTVSISGVQGSHERDGKIYLSVDDVPMVMSKKGHRYIPFFNVFEAAEHVGEEGLLGHQGQFLTSESAQIPAFLKNGTSQSSIISVEALGIIGKRRMVEEFSRNPRMVSTFSGDFESLRNRFEIAKENKILSRFMQAYEGYSYFMNGRNSEITAGMLYSITKDSEILSEIHRQRIKSYYEQSFWESPIRNSYRPWGYLLADLTEAKIKNRLESLSPAASKKIYDNLQLGYWTKKGFEQYFEYLVERFA